MVTPLRQAAVTWQRRLLPPPVGLTQSSVLEVPATGEDKMNPPNLNCHRYSCIPKDRWQVFMNKFSLGVSGDCGCMVVLFNALVVVVVGEQKKSISLSLAILEW